MTEKGSKWTRPKYSKEEVNKAAKLVRKWQGVSFINAEEISSYVDSFEILGNWRSSHGYPLNTFQVNLRRAARRIDANALVAQRTKRLISISAKLERLPNMKLTQMQDIGGCRAVLGNIEFVRNLQNYYLRTSGIKHIRASHDDYIERPKSSGYRGIHLVYRYFSDKHNTAVFNDMKIEMQIRSQYQHAWATAVETVGTFVKEALKSSLGPDEWLRFFSVMSSVIAIREGSPTVPGTPDNLPELIYELKNLVEELNVLHRLEAYGATIQRMESETKDASYYLLVLDPVAGHLTITGFRQDESAQAQKRYTEIEQIIKNDPNKDAVLVSVDSLSSLPRAYPNYFADTRMFLELVRQALTGEQKKIQPKAIKIQPTS